jgi:teichuronic acid biosynthesis glycosyltransferase TuaC
MRVLAVTKIFPNSVRPLAEPNMRQQYCALARLCELRVLATIPWYPGASLLARWSPAGSLSAVPPREIIAGLAVDHPRYLLVPVVGLPIQAHLYAASVLPSVWAARRDTDIIFSTFVYPDGVAAVLLGRLLRLPVVIEALGTDVNVVGQRPVVRRLLRRHLPDASRIVAVSRPLARSLCDLGARPDRVDVLPTGVDRSIFYPRQRGVERARLAVPGDAQVLLYVGNLVREKGIEDLVVAFQQVSRTNPKARLYVAGEGPLGAALSEGEEGRRGLIVRLGRLRRSRAAQLGRGNAERHHGGARLWSARRGDTGGWHP